MRIIPILKNTQRGKALYVCLILLCMNLTAQMKTVDFAGQFSKEQSFTLSEMATNVEYIKLEVVKESLIGEISQIEITKSYVFILSRGQVYMFSRDGKYIRKIGTAGRGPGEYVFAFSFGVNEQKKEIYIQASHNGKIMKFSFDGKNTDNISFHAGECFHTSNHSIGVANLETAFFEEWNGVRVQILDLNTKKETKIVYPNFKSDAPLFPSNFSYRYNDEIFTQIVNNDTVFKIKDNKFIPQYVFNMGQYRRKNLSFMQRDNNYMISTRTVKETKNYLFVNYTRHSNGSRNKAIYNKNAEILHTVKGNLLINDFDGGLDIWPDYTVGNNTLVACLDIFDVLEKLDNRHFSNSKAKDAQKKSELINFVNTLTENENPIIMLIHLK